MIPQTVAERIPAVQLETISSAPTTAPTTFTDDSAADDHLSKGTSTTVTVSCKEGASSEGSNASEEPDVERMSLLMPSQ